MNLRGAALLSIVAALGVAACTSETVTVVKAADSGSGASPDGSGGSSGSSGSSGQSGAGGSAASCQPDLRGWQPTWIPPAPIHQGRCSPSQIDAVAAACSDSDTGTPCEPGTSDVCRACLISASEDSQYSAFVRFTTPPIVHLNYEGCIAALTGDLSSTGCSATMLASEQCTIEACKTCPNQTSYSDCVRLAGTDPNACKSRVEERIACFAVVDQRIQRACGNLGQGNFAVARALGTVFCGANVGDAGVGDSGTD